MSFFATGQPATVHRPGGYDDDGIRTSTTPHQIASCAFDQNASATDDDGTITVTTGARLLCDDAQADVQPGDIIHLADDSWWLVSGSVERMVNSPFSGWAPGCVIPLESTQPLPTSVQS